MFLFTLMSLSLSPSLSLLLSKVNKKDRECKVTAKLGQRLKTEIFLETILYTCKYFQIELFHYSRKNRAMCAFLLWDYYSCMVGKLEKYTEIKRKWSLRMSPNRTLFNLNAFYVDIIEYSNREFCFSLFWKMQK